MEGQYVVMSEHLPLADDDASSAQRLINTLEALSYTRASNIYQVTNLEQVLHVQSLTRLVS